MGPDVRALALVMGLMWGLPVTLTAQEAPLSVIPWLSDTLQQPQGPGMGASVGAVEVTPLDRVGEPSGILPAGETGLPADLWAGATASDVGLRLAALPRNLPPSLASFLDTVILTEATPPRDEGDDLFLLTRVDRLLANGAIDRATALLEHTGPTSPERFRRFFDVTLLQGREDEACRMMRNSPEFSPTYPARIFCLARGGDWKAAAVTLETAHSLGLLDAEQDLLLARFLDAEIAAEFVSPPPPTRGMTPLEFRMLEAIGEPVPTTTLPIAFAWADLRPTRGWKTQIAAAERLAQAGTLPPELLIQLYLQERQSLSGAIWDRVAAVRELDMALTAGDPEEIGAALTMAWPRMRKAGLGHALAEAYAARLAEIPLKGQGAGEADELMMTAGLPPRRRGSRPHSFAEALSRGVPETAIARGPRAAAIREGFLADEIPARFSDPEGDLSHGEQLLLAIALIAEAAAGELDGLADALAYLRLTGHADVARQAGVELLLSGRA